MFMIGASGVTLLSGHNPVVVPLAIVACLGTVTSGYATIQALVLLCGLTAIVGLGAELFLVPHSVPVVAGATISMVLMILFSDGALFITFMLFLI